jgi:uncharacterized protein YfaS (alpha-2-macroglobulin family)
MNNLKSKGLMNMRDAQAIRFWTAFVVLVLLNIGGWAWMKRSVEAGRQQPQVHLIHAGGAEALGESGRLPLRFDRDLFVADSVGTTLVHSPFQMDPPVPGSWRVEARDQLIFEPHAPPHPGRTYRVTRLDNHPIFSRFSLTDDLPEINYQPLSLEEATISDIERIWDREGSSHDARIELIFNQPVTPDALAEHLTFLVNRKPVTPTFETQETSNTHLLKTSANFNGIIEFTLDSGMTGAGGTLGLEFQEHRRFTVPPSLQATAFRKRFRSFERAEVSIVFNRKLIRQTDLSSVSITPDAKNMIPRLVGNQLKITADFQPGTHYTINVDPPLRGADDTVLEERVIRSFTMPERHPSIRVKRSIGRMSPEGSFALDVQHVNVPEVDVTIHRLPERNIPLYLAGLDETWDVRRLGEVVAKSTLPIGGDDNSNPLDSVLELDRLIERTPGIYMVCLNIPGRPYWHETTSLLLVGDLGLHIQKDATGLLAWVNSVRTGLPTPGAHVKAWSPNREILFEGTTDADGLLRIPLPNGGMDLVTSSLGDDMTFIDPRKASRIDDQALSGSPWSKGLEVALYADRGVHRPGETIHLTGLLRTDSGAQVPDLPLEIQLIRPDGIVKSTRTVMSEQPQGLFHVDLQTHQSAPTGRWKVRCAVPGSETTLATLSCQVMPFVPVRLKVDTTVTVDQVDAEHPLTVDVAANYLHGAPGSDLPGTISVKFIPKRYQDDRFRGYRFEDAPKTDGAYVQKTVQLDEAGRNQSGFDEPPTPATWLARIESSVREPGGRATTHTDWATLDTATQHVGARVRGGALHEPHQPIRFDAVVLDAEGTPRTDQPIEARLFEVEQRWSLHRARGNNYTWRSQEETHLRSDCAIRITPTSEGLYELELSGLERGTYRLSIEDRVQSTLDFHVADHASRGRMAADRPDRLELIPEAGVHEPGAMTSVLLRSPFQGMALVTVETDRILATQLVPVDADGVRVPIRIPDTVRGTCFVGATVHRPVDPKRTEWLPTRAQGAIRLAIDDSAHRLTPWLSASDGARPGESVHVSLTVPELAADLEAGPVQANAIAHVWAVEEGALLVTDFHAPDLLSHLFRPRLRTVRSLDTCDTLLPDYERPVSWARIGGDAYAASRSPVPVRLRETAVLWQRQVPIDADGVLEFDLEMPDIDGAMRLMAVVIDDDRYGATEHTVAVAAPLEVVAVLPRAAAPGDRMSIPVRVQNRGSSPLDTTLELELPGNLSGTLGTRRLQIPPMSEEVVQLELEALAPGLAEVRITATPEQVSVAIEPRTLKQAIAIRPPHGHRSEVLRLTVPAGEVGRIERNHALEALDGRVEVMVDPSPIIDLTPILDDLIDYPYGCAEQTGSRLEGLLAMVNLPEQITGRKRSELDAMIATGINRLFIMQDRKGLIGYWPNHDGSPWISIRTGLILQEAERLGYEAPTAMMDRLARAIDPMIKHNHRRLTQSDRAMGLRFLAQHGTPDEDAMRNLEASSQQLDLESRAHLADACFDSGLEQMGQSLVVLEALPTVNTIASQGDADRFTSDLTQIAVTAQVLMEHRPDHPRITELIRTLTSSRTSRGWQTTYENSAAVAALARYHQRSGEPGDLEGSIQIAGKEVPFAPEGTTHLEFTTSDCSSIEELIRNNGSGSAHVVIRTTGIPLTDENDAVLEHGISIERRWLDHRGEPLPEGGTLASGDLVIVEVTARALANISIPNVAILEVLPGGMEFELPTLATSAASDKVRLSKVDHTVFHDDRMVAFTTLKSEPTRFQYVLRAIVPGDWFVPAADALSMYDPGLKAHGLGTRVEITP